MIKNCPKCSVEFDDYSKWGAKQFCSRKCANSKIQTVELNAKRSSKLSGRKLTEEHRKNLCKNGYPKTKEKYCLHCDKLFLSRKESQQFCSNKCWQDNNKLIMDDWHRYRLDCAFKFNVFDYPNYYDLTMIEKFGWYSAANRGNNLSGVSRDHMYSIKDGFRNNVDPSIIAHPANCCLMLHKDNNEKKTKSSITLEELILKIKNFVLLAE